MLLGRRNTSTEHLTALARDGNRRATAKLADVLCPRVARIAGAVAGDAGLGERLAREALTHALAGDETPIGAAVVAEAQRLAIEHRVPSDAPLADLAPRPRAAVLACEVEGFTPDRAARQLGVPREDVLDWLERGRRALGAAPAPRCAGWHLVFRYTSLSPAERSAADTHLSICRACRGAHESRETFRRRLGRDAPLHASSAAAGAGLGATLTTAVAGQAVATAAVATLAAGIFALPHVSTAARAAPELAGPRTARVPAAAVAPRPAPAVAEDAPVRTIDRPDRVAAERVAVPPGNDRESRNTATGDGPEPVTNDTVDTVDETTDTVDDSAEQVTDAVDTTTDGLTDAVDETTNGVTDAVDETADGIAETVNEATGTDAATPVAETVDGATDAADSTTGDATAVVDRTVDDATDAVDDATNTVDDATESTTDAVTEPVGGVLPR